MNPDSDEAQAKREAFYDRRCWCGHAMGNHNLIGGDCLLCDHATTAAEINEHTARHGRQSPYPPLPHVPWSSVQS